MKVRSVVPLLLAALPALLGACRADDGGEGLKPSDAAPGRRLVMIGGGLDRGNASVYSEVIAGRSGPICVIPTASGVPMESMESGIEAIESYGGPGSARGIFISIENPEAAADPAIAGSIRDCGGFYFTGGQQSRVAAVFRPGGTSTPAYLALFDRFLEGALVAGSSAGAAMMSTPMIAGGTSREALLSGTRSAADGDGVRMIEGMGFMTEAISDQHFLARGRWGRLLVAVLEPDAPELGLGVDENTALVIDGNLGRVVGASGVVLIDVRSAARTAEGGVEGARMMLLGRGDEVDLLSGDVRTDPEKGALPRDRPPDLRFPGPRVDPFERWALLHLLHDMAATDLSSVSFDIEGRTLTITRTPDFGAWSDGQEGIRDLPGGLAAGPFLVDLR